jgi:tetratricopeptide (TPR) repeat protein
MGIEIDYQLHRISVDIAKGFRQFQKADSELAKGNIDSTVNHLNKGLNLFETAGDHAAKAEDDAYKKAGDAIDKGDKNLQKAIDAYADGNVDSAANHYADALDSYDKALDLIS